MVYQFAAALHGAWPFRECPCCHKFFRLVPGVNRANRLTCSRTCKQYLHNRRIERARQLHCEGNTPRQIVKELNVKPQGKKSSVDIVRTWIDRATLVAAALPVKAVSTRPPEPKSLSKLLSGL